MSQTRHTMGMGTVLDTGLYMGIYYIIVMVLDTVLGYDFGYVIVLEKTQVLSYVMGYWPGEMKHQREIYIYTGTRAYETSMEIFLPLFAA